MPAVLAAIKIGSTGFELDLACMLAKKARVVMYEPRTLTSKLFHHSLIFCEDSVADAEVDAAIRAASEK